MTTVTPLPERGRSDAERALFAALTKLAAQDDGLAWAGNVQVDVLGCAREVDALVMYRGRVFGIEVDGPHHARRGRYVADRSRDLLFEDAGLLFVRRIAVEDTNDPQEVERFVLRCLTRLDWWRGAA